MEEATAYAETARPRQNHGALGEETGEVMGEVRTRDEARLEREFTGGTEAARYLVRGGVPGWGPKPVSASGST